MYQEIGAALDSLLFIVAGVFAVWGYPRVVARKAERNEAEPQAERSVKWVRWSGLLMLVGGVGGLVLKLLDV